MFSGLFVETLVSDPLLFICVVITVVISITLHELAHGWMAIRHGDRTPIYTGHMTGNPLVHMGIYSIIMLLVAGIAWGSMPIDPTRMRGRYAEAKVAFAGPATNLLLGLIAMTAAGVWLGLVMTMPERGTPLGNLHVLLQTFGMINVALFLFNLLPIPPLDGSHMLANFHRPYALFIGNPRNHGALMFMYLFIFLLGCAIFDFAGSIAFHYIQFVITTTARLT